MLDADPNAKPSELLGQVIVSSRGKTIRPKTEGQRAYVDAIDEYTIVFGIGPAGTGKTYLAMAKAVQALQRKEVSRIILTRPAVEAGERLGFLPGTLTDKIDPYLRPLYDALNEMMDPELVPKLLASGTVEVAPLAYMRGRTLNDSFVVLDEAQNTTPEQMKMFLTRLGFGSQDGRHRRHHADRPARRRERAATRHAHPRPRRRHPLRAAHERRRRAAHRSSAASSTPTPSTTSAPRRSGSSATRRASSPTAPSAAATPARATTCRGRASREHRDQQRIGDRGRRGRDPAARRLRARRDARAPRRRDSRSCSSTRARWSSCTCSGWTSPARPTC